MNILGLAAFKVAFVGGDSDGFWALCVCVCECNFGETVFYYILNIGNFKVWLTK